jgi:diphosphomevalonate decarboxylase
METSRLTSPLLKFRAEHVVQPRLEEIEKAYLNRDFQIFGKITMQDSNQFHATCLDTYPPIFYLNDTSKVIMRLCHVINSYYGDIRAAYTFDAGPNAVIYCLERDAAMIAAAMAKFFPAPDALDDYCNNPTELGRVINDNSLLPTALVAKLNETGRLPIPGDVKYIFLTKSGPGPISQPSSESLLDPASGLPVQPSSKHKRMVIAPAKKNLDNLTAQLNSRYYKFLLRDTTAMLIFTGAALGVIIAARSLLHKN